MSFYNATPPKSVWDRSDTYRQDFLRNNKGIFNRYYICCYCGKIISRKNMQVDHHIAINLVRKNPYYKMWFRLRNFATNLVGRTASLVTGKPYKPQKGVNVDYNLIPACIKCNHAKSDLGGKWIVRGYIGGTVWKIINLIDMFIRWLWHFPAVKIAVICFAAFIFMQFYFTGGGVLASMLSGFGHFFGTIWAGISTATKYIVSGITFIFGPQLFKI